MYRPSLFAFMGGALITAAVGGDLPLNPLAMAPEIPGQPLSVIMQAGTFPAGLSCAASAGFGQTFDLNWLSSNQTTDRLIDDLFDGFLANAAREGVALGLGEDFRLRDYDQPCLISQVEGNSMVPLILPGDLAAINRRFPFSEIRTNDIIAFISPGFFHHREFVREKVVKNKEGQLVRVNGLHLVIHQVSRILRNPKSGVSFLETRGVNNLSGCDPFWVKSPQSLCNSERFSTAVYLGKAAIVHQTNSRIQGHEVLTK